MGGCRRNWSKSAKSDGGSAKSSEASGDGDSDGDNKDFVLCTDDEGGSPLNPPYCLAPTNISEPCFYGRTEDAFRVRCDFPAESMSADCYE